MSIHPNPTSGLLNVVIASSEASFVNLKVSNLLGQVVYRWQGEIEGRWLNTVNLRGLPAGQYVISVKSSAGVQQQMIVVKR